MRGRVLFYISHNFFFLFINIIILLVSLCLWFHVIVRKTKYLFKTNSIHYRPINIKIIKYLKSFFCYLGRTFWGEAYSIFNYIHLPIHMSNRCLRNDLSLQNTVMEMETTTRYNSFEENLEILKVFSIFPYTSTW